MKYLAQQISWEQILIATISDLLKKYDDKEKPQVTRDLKHFKMLTEENRRNIIAIYMRPVFEKIYVDKIGLVAIVRKKDGIYIYGLNISGIKNITIKLNHFYSNAVLNNYIKEVPFAWQKLIPFAIAGLVVVLYLSKKK